jgi:hypothetical protein
MEFTINRKTTAPGVILTSPKNNTFITGTDIKPTLSWQLSYNGPNVGNISYDVFVDINPIPINKIASGIKSTQYALTEPLTNDQTFYWRVIPRLDDIEGYCQSGIWTFATISTDPGFGIDLIIDQENLRFKPGETGIIDFTINNHANITDTITITIVSREFDINDIELNLETFTIPASGSEKGSITLNIQENVEEKSYQISLTASSLGAINYGQNVKTTKEFSIIISKQSDESTDKTDNTFLLGAVLGVILIILILLILIFMKLKSKQKPSKSPPSKDVPKVKRPGQIRKVNKIQNQRSKNIKNKRNSMKRRK